MEEYSKMVLPSRGWAVRLKPFWVFLSFALILTVHIYLLTRGDWNLISSEYLGDSYDALGDSLLKGEASVPLDRIRAEAYLSHGKSFMYFAPFPALARVALSTLYPAGKYRWSRISCVAADLLCLIAFALIVTRGVRKNQTLGKGAKVFLFLLCLFGFGLGSPLSFLMSIGSIYHESILWAFAGSLWALYFFIPFTEGSRVSLGQIAGFSLFSGIAFLSKVTFGFPFMALIPLAGLVLLRQHSKSENKADGRLAAELCCLGVPFFICGLFYAWYNQIRFGSPFRFIDLTTYIQFHFFPQDLEPFLRLDVFDPRRIGNALSIYFGVLRGNFSAHFPFIQMLPVPPLSPSLYPPSRHELIISLIVSAPWIVFTSVCGVFGLVASRSNWVAKLSALPLLGQSVLILAYFYLAPRYGVEFLPLFVFLSVFMLATSSFKKNTKILYFGFMVLLVGYSIAATSLSTLFWMDCKDFRETFGNLKPFLKG